MDETVLMLMMRVFESWEMDYCYFLLLCELTSLY